MMSRRIGASLLIAMSLAGCATKSVSTAGATTRQAAKAVDVTATLRYLQYLPPTYASDPTNKVTGDGRGWPLVLFLHGSGEAGTDLNKVKKHGLPMLVEQGKDFPFILISPQSPEDADWIPAQLFALLGKVERELHVDPDRVYVTGLSMGGYGTYALAGADPSRFAAIAPICGAGDPDRLIAHPAIKNLPVWAIHGAEDKAVPLEDDQAMIDALKKAGNTDVTFSVLPGVGHNAWTKTYNDPAIYDWLLSHKRVSDRRAESDPR